MDTKTCTWCHIEKPIADYHKYNKKYTYMCNNCRKINPIKGRKKYAEEFLKKRNYLRCVPYNMVKLAAKNKNSNVFLKHANANINEFKFHLEKHFLLGMTWENYGKWEIDHIKPWVSCKTLDCLAGMNHLNNIQPLWKDENRRKYIEHDMKIYRLTSQD
jgi:hypothetical protein